VLPVCCRLFGCYEALDGGELSEALEDFTGGVSETTDLTAEPFSADETQRDRFYDWLVRAVDNNSLMCAAITVSQPWCGRRCLADTIWAKLSCLRWLGGNGYSAGLVLLSTTALLKMHTGHMPLSHISVS